MGGCSTCKVGGILVLIGGINWGLIGLGSFLQQDLNVIHMVLKGLPWQVEAVLYILVGLAAICKLIKVCKCCR